MENHSELYFKRLQELESDPKVWLITGVAGFIGSNLLETLLRHKQKVVGLDNFATGHRHNLEGVRAAVGTKAWELFSFVEGDIRDFSSCESAMSGVDIVLHQAALGSVPRSIRQPRETNSVNIDGFVNILVAAQQQKVNRVVYAASSSTYGDHPGLPKVEDTIGKPLSPYAVTKYVNEMYADVFYKTYGLNCIGLRYFNVFGPRQDPQGAYAAVIPLWFHALINKEPCYINGDGETTRDFCFIENTIQANILAATVPEQEALNQVYNVAYGARTSLNQLQNYMGLLVQELLPGVTTLPVQYRSFREGDVLHSQADITKAKRLLGYNPQYGPFDGLQLTAKWFVGCHQRRNNTQSIAPPGTVVGQK